MENVGPLVSFPIFYAQSYYDPAHIDTMIGFSCTNSLHSLSECTKEERTIIQDYHKQV